MDVDDATSVNNGANPVFSATARDTDRRATKLDLLERIERTAKARDDVGVQNDAHYELQVVRSEQYWFPIRILDFVFYRTIAGYLVRPLNPLIAWIIFVGIVSAVRLSRRHDLLMYSARTPGQQRLRRIAAMGAAVVRSLEEFADALTSVGPRRVHESGTKRSALEVNTSRALLACVLVAVASANPTLRELFNAF